MNKKTYAVMAVVAIVLIAGVNVYHSQRAVEMSDVALANVEALAQTEVEFPYYCTGSAWECWDDVYYQTFAGKKHNF